MIHGLIKGREIELFSHSGVCLTSLQALKTAYMCIRAGLNHNAVCCASELPSAILLSKNFNAEYDAMSKVEEHPIIAFHKDFLRFMLSDGACSVLLESEPRGTISLKKVSLLFYFCKCFSCKKTSFTFSFFSLVLFFVLVCFSLSFICLRTVLFLSLYVYHCLTTFVVKSNHEGGQS